MSFTVGRLCRNRPGAGSDRARNRRTGTDLIAAPQEDSSEGDKDDSDEEESWENRRGRQNRLPRLEPLLLERRVCVALERSARWSRQVGQATSGSRLTRGTFAPVHLVLLLLVILLQYLLVLLFAALAVEQSHRVRSRRCAWSEREARVAYVALSIRD